MPTMSSMESEGSLAGHVQIAINGKAQSVAPGTSVDDLLQTLGLDPAQVAVERNGEIVPRKTRAHVQLQPGDRLELVTFVGGG